MYIHVAPSSDHSLLTLNLPFKVILRFGLFSDALGEIVNDTQFLTKCLDVLVHVNLKT